MSESPQYPPKTGKTQDRQAGARDPLLTRLGERVRDARRRLGWTRDRLAERSELSPRYLARVEAGDGNISIVRLRNLARALGTTPDRLIAPESSRPQAIALVGMRGAGKSTVGPALANALGLRFVEMDDRIAEAAGLRQDQIFELHGAGFYRRIEREVLRELLLRGEPMVLATPGGVVEEPANWELLLEGTHVVWLKARVDDHWDRVVGQGDDRPMRDRPDARETLRSLLQSRERRYRDAHVTVDTHGRSPREIVAALADRLRTLDGRATQADPGTSGRPTA